MPSENDPHLHALYRELRATIRELNQLHHPVYPGDPARIAELEEIVAEIRKTIRERRDLVTAQAEKPEKDQLAGHGSAHYA